MRLYAFGEILWDVFVDEKHIGGAALNFAAHFSLHGGESFMLSALGDDPLGREASRCLSDYGISARHVCIHPDKPTGESIVTLGCGGVPTYRITEDTAYDYISTEGIDVADDDLIYFGTLALRREYNRRSLATLISRSTPREIFADVNLRAPFIYRETILYALQNASILKISDEELPSLCTEVYGEVLDHRAAAHRIAAEFCPRIVIVTLGADGAYVYDGEGDREYSAPAARVRVASTVGAGDSFSAAFLYRYVHGDSIQDALNYATRVSAYVVSCEEAVPKYVPSQFTDGLEPLTEG